MLLSCDSPIRRRRLCDRRVYAELCARGACVRAGRHQPPPLAASNISLTNPEHAVLLRPNIWPKSRNCWECSVDVTVPSERAFCSTLSVSVHLYTRFRPIERRDLWHFRFRAISTGTTGAGMHIERGF